jgi:hypothetical protein
MRRELLRTWHATGEALERLGYGVLAEQARRFTKGLPPARTEREWLSEGVLEQVRRKRPPEMERPR